MDKIGTGVDEEALSSAHQEKVGDLDKMVMVVNIGDLMTLTSAGPGGEERGS